MENTSKWTYTTKDSQMTTDVNDVMTAIVPLDIEDIQVQKSTGKLWFETFNHVDY